MATVTLSTIAGVTVYATEPLAKSGAVDSGAALNTWMRAQTSGSASPITLLWDGWIYVANMANDVLQYTPNASGWITHKPANSVVTKGVFYCNLTNGGSGYGSPPSVTFSASTAPGGSAATGTAVLTSGVVTSITITDPGKYAPGDTPTVTFGSGAAAATAYCGGNAGAVWASKTTASPNLANGGRTSNPANVVVTDVTFTTNSSSLGLTFDGNALTDTPTQPHDDSTWGWAFLLEAAGVNNMTLNGVTFLNSRSFHTRFVGGDNLSVTNCLFSSWPHSVNYANWDGVHVNGPYTHVYVANCNFNCWDDSVGINEYEPVEVMPNYLAPSWMSGWVGGDISHVKLLNNVLLNASQGYRFLPFQHNIDDVLVDGLTGNVWGYIMTLDNYPQWVTYPQGPTGAPGHIGTITIRNVNVQSYVPPGASGFHYNFPGSFTGGRINVWGVTIDNLNLDLTSCTPVSADGAQSPPFLYVTQDSVIRNHSYGPVANLRVRDAFQRANSSVVGNGWTDVDTKFVIAGNTLQHTGDGSGHNLLREGTGDSATANSSITFSLINPNTSVEVVSVQRLSGNNQYYGALLPNGSGSTQAQLHKIVSGSDTSIWTFTDGGASVGTYSRLTIDCAGSFLVPTYFNCTTRKTQGVTQSIVDTSLAGLSGYPGITAANTAGHVVNIYDVAVVRYDALPTLTGITVTQTGIDSLGNILFTATPTPSTANIGGAVWTTSSGIINNFGQVHNVSAGQTITVTCTVGGVSGSANYTVPIGISVASTGTTTITVKAATGRTDLYALLGSTAADNPYSGAMTTTFNTATPGYEAYNSANWANYAITLTETGAGTGVYTATVPSGARSALVYERVYAKAGGSPASSDVLQAAGAIPGTGGVGTGTAFMSGIGY